MAPRAVAAPGALSNPYISSSSQAGSERGGARVLVLPIRFTGKLSAADRRQLEGDVLDGLRRAEFEVIEGAELDGIPARELECDTPACGRRLAERSRADYLVQARVVIKDRDYALKLSLVDGSSGEQVAQTEGGCEICGIAEASSLVSSGAATLRTKLDAIASGPTRFSLDVQPRGAQVWIDGELIGSSPLETVVEPGAHRVKISHPGYVTVEREMTFVRGVRESSNIMLAKQVATKVVHGAWGWTALGLGVAGLAVGVTFVGLHGKDYKLQCDSASGDRDSAGNCRYIWNSQWAGLGGAVAGAALASVGIILIVRRSKALAAAGSPGRTRASLGAGREFARQRAADARPGQFSLNFEFSSHQLRLSGRF